MKEFDCSTWNDNSKLDVVIRFLGDCSIAGRLQPGPVVGMNTLQVLLPTRRTVFRVKIVYAIPFFGEVQWSSAWRLPGKGPYAQPISPPEPGSYEFGGEIPRPAFAH